MILNQLFISLKKEMSCKDTKKNGYTDFSYHKKRKSETFYQATWS